MGLADKMEKLARIIPGVAGYQDSDSARDTDKAVRVKLAHELEEIKIALEAENRRLIEANELSLLPALDKVASKLDKTANKIRYAERGFSGIFDRPRVDLTRLEKALSFDISLIEDAASLKVLAKNVHGASVDTLSLKNAITELDMAVDGFDSKFSTRQSILTAQ